MKTRTDDWSTAPLSAVLIYSILFLTILPSLGWAWHRVLPEHTHVYIGVTHSDTDEILPALPTPDDPPPCLDCKTPQLRSGLVHLPDPQGLQVLGVAASVGVLFFHFVPPAFPERAVISPFLYRPPVVLPPDPPPTLLWRFN